MIGGFVIIGLITLIVLFLLVVILRGLIEYVKDDSISGIPGLLVSYDAADLEGDHITVWRATKRGGLRMEDCIEGMRRFSKAATEAVNRISNKSKEVKQMKSKEYVAKSTKVRAVSFADRRCGAKLSDLFSSMKGDKHYRGHKVSSYLISTKCNRFVERGRGHFKTTRLEITNKYGTYEFSNGYMSVDANNNIVSYDAKAFERLFEEVEEEEPTINEATIKIDYPFGGSKKWGFVIDEDALIKDALAHGNLLFKRKSKSVNIEDETPTIKVAIEPPIRYINCEFGIHTESKSKPIEIMARENNLHKVARILSKAMRRSEKEENMMLTLYGDTVKSFKVLDIGNSNARIVITGCDRYHCITPGHLVKIDSSNDMSFRYYHNGMSPAQEIASLVKFVKVKHEDSKSSKSESKAIDVDALEELLRTMNYYKSNNSNEYRLDQINRLLGGSTIYEMHIDEILLVIEEYNNDDCQNSIFGLLGYINNKINPNKDHIDIVQLSSILDFLKEIGMLKVEG